LTHRQARFLLGPLLLAAVVGVFFADKSFQTPVLTPLIVVALAAAALIEYRRLFGPRLTGYRGAALFAGGSLFLVTLVVWPADLVWLWSAGLAGVMCGFAGLMRGRWRGGVCEDDLTSLGAIALAWIVVIAPAAFMVATLKLTNGLEWIVTMVVGSKLNDIGGYVVGSALGRRKLCPAISPNKSVEGAVAGALLGVGGVVALASFLDPGAPWISPWQAVIFGALLSVATQFGDLFESQLKRSAGVKDSGALIPAFGGILDLVDSLIFAAPVGYAVASAWLG